MTCKAEKIQIRVECTGADRLPLDAIEEFQGKLKKRSKQDIERIITSIDKYGFSFPFFVWNGDGHNRCLDGHGRLQALAEMRRRGCDLPTFPVAYVEAADEAEAKQKLLRLNSAYGEITGAGLAEFIDGIEVDEEEIDLRIAGDITSKVFKNSDAEFDRKLVMLPLVVATTEKNYRMFERAKDVLGMDDDEECVMALVSQAVEAEA